MLVEIKQAGNIPQILVSYLFFYFRFGDRSHDEKNFVFGTHLDLSQLCKNLQEKTCPYLARLLKRGDGVSCKLVAAVVILIIGVAFYFVKGHVVYLG